MAVGYNHCDKAVFGKTCPDGIFVAGHNGWDAVSMMRQRAGACVCEGFYRFGFCRLVAQ